MTNPHSNSAVERATNSVWIETGQIINVDIAHWTVDVRTKNTHRQLLDKQVCAPYLHFNHGEGIYAMPEVGAKCMVCSPSDDDPFVLCFVTAFEREPVEGEATQGGSEPTGAAALTGEDEEAAQSEVTYRAGRPRLQQGDIMMRTRDGNQIWLHRGGMVEIGATHMAKRVYIPISNTIRDIFENYQARSTAGDMTWKTIRSDTDAAGDAKTLFALGARRYAADAKASVLLQAGHVSEEEGNITHLRCIVAQDAIDPDTGEVEGEGAVYDFKVNAAGDVDVSVSGSITMAVTGNVDITCSGDGNLTFSNLTETVSGNWSVSVSGSHTLDAADSTENVNGTKTINCPTVQLGGSGGSKVMLVTPSVIAFGQHTHTVTGGSTGPPTPPLTSAQMEATKVYGQ